MSASGTFTTGAGLAARAHVDRISTHGGGGTVVTLSRWRPGPNKEVVMRYRVYSGPPGTDEVSLVRQDQMLFKEFGNLDEALSWSRHLEKSGRAPLLIEGDDGTRMNKREIGEALRLGSREEVAADNFGGAASRR